MNFFKKSNATFLLCNILIPLAIGAYVYIFWDNDSYFGNFVRSVIPIPNMKSDSNIMRIMRNWGCDFLYAYAVLFVLYASTRSVPIAIRYTTICSIGLELLQLIQVDFLKCGTFDIVDIIIEIIAICFAATLIVFRNHIYKSKVWRK